MQSAPPPLLPLLRSSLQGELLALLLLNPDREWSLTELANGIGASVSTAQREVERAEQSGVVESRRVGSARLVRAHPSPLTEPLAELLLRSFGPPQVVAEEFAGIEGIDEVHLLGSWAARYAGEIGRAPGDIDVLVIGAPDRDVAYEAAERASRRLAHEVNVTFRSRELWAEGVDGFHTEVLTRPRVQVLPVAQVKP